MPEILVIILIAAVFASLIALFFVFREYRQLKVTAEQREIEKHQISEQLNRLQTQQLSAQERLQESQHQLEAAQTRIRELEHQNSERHQQIDTQTATIQTLQHSLKESEQREQALINNQVEWRNRLQQQEQRTALLRQLSDSAYDALLVLDANYKVLATNKAANELFGIEQLTSDLTLIDVTRSPVLEMMVEDTLVNEEESLEEQMTLGEHTFLVSTQVIRQNENVLIGLALQDISQLIRLNRARRDMVANISHELRTPIANIRLIIDGLFHEQDKPKRKESISSLRAIAHETETLLWLVQEMADLSMIESGQAIIRMVDVALWNITEEATDRLADQMDAKHLKFVKKISENIHVLCDRDLIQRVLVNLLHNAMKWSPTGGTITLAAEQENDEVVISIFDNGPGVPDDQVDRIFERFYQVDASRSGGEGTGLGLAICKHIVTAHGGRIWAEGNSQGRGGRFKFTLLSSENLDTSLMQSNVNAGIENGLNSTEKK
jgi:two-component system, OmpR family, phosphate regulon sensor histidine kinase PhoR